MAKRSIDQLKKEIAILEKKDKKEEERRKLEAKLEQLKSKKTPSLPEKIEKGRRRIRKKLGRFTTFMDNVSI